MCVCARVHTYLAGERQCGRHLLHGQIADARAERAAAGRAAAQLLAALVADQVTRLALQDGRQHVVETYRALEQPRELRRLAEQARRGQGQHGGRGGGPRPGHGAHTGGGTSTTGPPVLSPACFPGAEHSTCGSG